METYKKLDAFLKEKYKEVFEIDPKWLVKITAARGKWIDQSQSHNVFLNGVSGKLLSEVYIAGWKAGLKTFYYLRTLGASQIEKSTLDANKFGFTQKRSYEETSFTETPTVEQNETQSETTPVACSLDTDCDSCQ
jgi:ribonucleoside-diphosphate reductase alpha chain